MKGVPHLNQLNQKFRSRGFEVVAVSDESASAIRDFMNSQGVQYGVVRAEGVLELFGGSGYPSAWVIDPNGTVIWSGHPARITDADVEGWLQSSSSVAATPGGSTSSVEGPNVGLFIGVLLVAVLFIGGVVFFLMRGRGTPKWSPGGATGVYTSGGYGGYAPQTPQAPPQQPPPGQPHGMQQPSVQYPGQQPQPYPQQPQPPAGQPPAYLRPPTAPPSPQQPERPDTSAYHAWPYQDERPPSLQGAAPSWPEDPAAPDAPRDMRTRSIGRDSLPEDAGGADQEDAPPNDLPWRAPRRPTFGEDAAEG